MLEHPDALGVRKICPILRTPILYYFALFSKEEKTMAKLNRKQNQQVTTTTVRAPDRLIPLDGVLFSASFYPFLFVL